MSKSEKDQWMLENDALICKAASRFNAMDIFEKDDLLQEARLAAYKALDTYCAESNRSVSTYIWVGVQFHLCKMFRKTSERKEKMVFIDDESLTRLLEERQVQLNGDGSPVEQGFVSGAGFDDYVQQLIEREVPSCAKETVRQWAMGKTAREIAETGNISVRTVSRHIKRSSELLQEPLSGWYTA